MLNRALRFLLAFSKAYGPTSIKKVLWDKEYHGTKWNFADNTVGDCVYRHLDRYAANGNVLDIGCGSGNTATEMANGYQSYVGVDISEEALAKASRRSKECGRGQKNRFDCGDFLYYVPTGKYDVILFRESIYHIPIAKMKATLERYATFLTGNGVIIVRLFASERQDGANKDKPRPAAMIKLIESEFEVLEESKYEDVGRPVVVVFRPKASLQPGVDIAQHTPEPENTLQYASPSALKKF